MLSHLIFYHLKTKNYLLSSHVHLSLVNDGTLFDIYIVLLSIQEQAENHRLIMDEKEQMIDKLRHTLAAKDNKLQEAINRSPNNDSLLRQLQHRLQEKEDLLQVGLCYRSTVKLKKN